MELLIFDTPPDPEVTLTNIAGDLRLFGWEQNQVRVEASDEKSVQGNQENGRVTVRANSDCTVRVPRNARLTLQNVGGDARIKSIDGPLTVGQVGGDLTLRQTLAVNVENVGGDVSAKKIGGPLTINSTGSDVSVRGVAGEVVAENVGGDLYLREVSAGARGEASGDIILNVDFASNHTYAFEAGGDILCRISGGSVRLEADSGGEVSVNLPGAKVEGSDNDKTVTLGDGAANVTLEAGGDISITPTSGDPEAMGEFGDHFGDEFGVMAEEFAAHIESQVEAQIESQMAGFEQHLNEQLAHLNLNLGHVDAERIAARAREAAERVSEKMRRKGEAAQRRAEALADAARRREEAARRREQSLAEAARRREEAARRREEQQVERGKRKLSYAFKFDAPRPPTPPMPPMPPRPPTGPIPRATPPAEAVSDEERMTILRMVEQKKITIEDAEKLLAALEGK